MVSLALTAIKVNYTIIQNTLEINYWSIHWVQEGDVKRVFWAFLIFFGSVNLELKSWVIVEWWVEDKEFLKSVERNLIGCEVSAFVVRKRGKFIKE